MAKFYDEDGQEIEGVLTQEEADKKIDEAKEEISKQFEQQTTESAQKITELSESLEATKAQIEAAKATGEGEGDKQENLSQLRAKLKQTEEALETEKKSNEERWQSVQTDKVTSAIRAIAGDDEEMAKKIEHEFATTLSGVKATTAEEIAKKVESAKKLATNIEAPSALDGVIGGGSRGIGGHAPVGGGREITAKDKELGAKLGLSEEDYKKYGKDPRRTK